MGGAAYALYALYLAPSQHASGNATSVAVFGQ